MKNVKTEVNNNTQNLSDPNNNSIRRSGFITIVGKPNVGKSSLMNAFVGEKVSIVTPKSQTTRDKVLGILTENNYQMIFIDTPGIHEPKTELGKYMNRAVSNAGLDADAVLVVLDATKPLTAPLISIIERFLTKSSPVYVAINKLDLAGFGGMYPMLQKLASYTAPSEGRAGIKEIVPISCKSGENISKLKVMLLSELPEGEFFYPQDEITDRPIRFLVEEMIREKALLYLQDEIPHGIGVAVQSMDSGERLVRIEADIVCERDTHKLIVIGEGGQQLRQIGESARRDIEKLLDNKVHLQLFVKVRDNWRNRRNIMDDLGYRKQ